MELDHERNLNCSYAVGIIFLSCRRGWVRDVVLRRSKSAIDWFPDSNSILEGSIFNRSGTVRIEIVLVKFSALRIRNHSLLSVSSKSFKPAAVNHSPSLLLYQMKSTPIASRERKNDSSWDMAVHWNRPNRMNDWLTAQNADGMKGMDACSY